MCHLQAKLAEFKAAGFDVDLEFLDAALIALQGKTFTSLLHLTAFSFFLSSVVLIFCLNILVISLLCCVIILFSLLFYVDRYLYIQLLIRCKCLVFIFRLDLQIFYLHFFYCLISLITIILDLFALYGDQYMSSSSSFPVVPVTCCPAAFSLSSMSLTDCCAVCRQVRPWLRCCRRA